jgi:nondiscriminating glutamyl-tRNA synthetase
VPAVDVRLHDLVRGEIRFAAGAVGDFILLRSDGYPTYNFACVLDDSAMAITHVVRGEDHLSNTVRQQLLYAALGAAPPEFAHVSLILGPDREKLSKREGASSTAELRRLGYLPEAVVNFLALLGWSPEDGREKMTREELVGRFSLERVNRAAAIFDVAKLTWLNGLYIRERSADDLYPLAAPYLEDAGIRDRDRGIAMLKAVQSEIERISDLPRVLPPLTRGDETPEATEVLAAPRAVEILEAAVKAVSAIEQWSGAAFKAAVVKAGAEAGVRGRDLFMPVRAALTGNVHGPELPLVAEALGRETALARMRRAVDSRRAGRG